MNIIDDTQGRHKRKGGWDAKIRRNARAGGTGSRMEVDWRWMEVLDTPMMLRWQMGAPRRSKRWEGRRRHNYAHSCTWRPGASVFAPSVKDGSIGSTWDSEYAQRSERAGDAVIKSLRHGQSEIKLHDPEIKHLLGYCPRSERATHVHCPGGDAVKQCSGMQL
ncbi:hypothetical protein FB451DRAFT_1170425 [Mycena latifolia]|nr:hypothetical protein FB451DRAFT_1170425 [Mycena latifolia]